MAGTARSRQPATRAAGRRMRLANPAALPETGAPRKRGATPPPRRATLDARVIDWWRSLPRRTRTGYRGAGIFTFAALFFGALLVRTDPTSPLSFAGAIGFALFGWGSYPLLVLGAAWGAAQMVESVAGRAVMRRALPVLLFFLWCLLMAGSRFFLGNGTAGLAGEALALPLGYLPAAAGGALILVPTLWLLLAIVRVTPAHLGVAARFAGRHTWRGARATGRGVGIVARSGVSGVGRLARRGRSQRAVDPMAQLAAATSAHPLGGDTTLDLPPESPPVSAQAMTTDDELELEEVPRSGPPDADDPPEAAAQGFPDAGAVRGAWKLPPLDLFDEPQAAPEDTNERMEELAQRLEQVLRSFRVDAEVRREDISVGPTVIRFGIRPVERPRRDDRGRVILDEDGQPILIRTRVSRIMNLRNDLALALEAHSLRMEAPVPGQPYVGLEIPRPRSRMVTLHEILSSEEFQQAAGRSKLTVTLGRDVSGQVRAADMAKFPHVLVAGATGAGKSVCLNAFLSSILSQATPEEVRLLLVDPKKVELTVYNGIPHLLAPVVTEAKAVPPLLKQALEEMERRYQLFSHLGVRNLEGYRHLAKQEPELGLENLPSIVIVIDELADLMMAAPEEVEYMICRLAQLARATGLHLVVATQRPSVDVITGLIKANIPTRVAFMVSSQVDSRTILDMGGAEHLLGRGDSLFLSADASKPERIQGAFVSDEEVTRLVGFWRAQARQAAIPARAADRVAARPLARRMPVAPTAREEDVVEPPIPPLPIKRGQQQRTTTQGEDAVIRAERLEPGGPRGGSVRAPFPYMRPLGDDADDGYDVDDDGDGDYDELEDAFDGDLDDEPEDDLDGDGIFTAGPDGTTMRANRRYVEPWLAPDWPEERSGFQH